MVRLIVYGLCLSRTVFVCDGDVIAAKRSNVRATTDYNYFVDWLTATLMWVAVRPRNRRPPADMWVLESENCSSRYVTVGHPSSCWALVLNKFTTLFVSKSCKKKMVIKSVNKKLYLNWIYQTTHTSTIVDDLCELLKSSSIPAADHFGSRPSDHYFRSVCLSVCLFVQSFSQPSLIRFRSN